MARRRLHTLDDLLDVAEDLVTSGDPSGLTLRSLATAAGASNGSIYHAFSSKDQLLAQLWLRSWSRLNDQMEAAVQASVDERPDARGGSDVVVDVALASVDFVRRYPTSARLFFAQRRDQLFSAELPADIQVELAAVRKRFIDMLITLARLVWDRGDREAVEAIAVCVVDLPTGILRRRILEDRGVDDATTRRLEAAVGAVLAVPLAPPSPRTASISGSSQ